MKKLFRLLFLFILPAILVSCETDFNVIADYKEVAIVYGLLNQNDSIHYLRINKAFLGNGNALTYAQVADSSSFGANIKVVLIESNVNNVVLDSIVFDTITLYNKEPGDFYSPGQLFYASTAKLNENNLYELKIRSKKSNYVVSSKTSLVHDFAFSTPSSGAQSLNFKRSYTQQMKFIWQNALNGKRYQFAMHYNFKELGSSGDTTYRTVDWVFPEQVTEKTDGDFKIDVPYTNEDFFKMCESKIPYTDAAAESAVLKRFSSTCDLEVAVVGDEFNTYLDANGPSTGVLMEKPSYSNITNGIGLFSCKYQMHWHPEVPPLTRMLKLSAETILDLATTTNLKFVKPN